MGGKKPSSQARVFSHIFLNIIFNLLAHIPGSTESFLPFFDFRRVFCFVFTPTECFLMIFADLTPPIDIYPCQFFMHSFLLSASEPIHHDWLFGPCKSPIIWKGFVHCTTVILEGIFYFSIENCNAWIIWLMFFCNLSSWATALCLQNQLQCAQWRESFFSSAVGLFPVWCARAPAHLLRSLYPYAYNCDTKYSTGTAALNTLLFIPVGLNCTPTIMYQRLASQTTSLSRSFKLLASHECSRPNPDQFYSYPNGLSSVGNCGCEENLRKIVLPLASLDWIQPLRPNTFSAFVSCEIRLLQHFGKHRKLRRYLF